MTPSRKEITSTQNSRIKDVVRLRKRSARDESMQVLVEGYREISRALENNAALVELFICPSLYLGENEDGIVEQAQSHGATIYDCSEPVFRKIAYRERPEGLLAICKKPKINLSEIDLPEDALVVVTEGIEKPGNLGTILRSADATGVHLVIVCGGGTDIYNPNTVRASIGTLFSLPVVEAEPQEALAWLKAKGVHVVATTPHAQKLYTDVLMTGGVAIVVGAEQYGISSIWNEEADHRVRIPMLGQIDSLNVASATTIMLYEAVRQRGGKR